MKKRYLLAVVGVVMATSVLVHPAGAVKAAPSRGSLSMESGIEPGVAAMLNRSCTNCHSNETRWPWYSYVAPASWLLERDVMEARSHLNFSDWRQYDAEKRVMLLATIGAAVRNHQMPPYRYTLLHPEARLTAAEISVLYLWTRDGKRCRSASPTADSRGFH